MVSLDARITFTTIAIDVAVQKMAERDGAQASAEELIAELRRLLDLASRHREYPGTCNITIRGDFTESVITSLRETEQRGRDAATSSENERCIQMLLDCAERNHAADVVLIGMARVIAVSCIPRSDNSMQVTGEALAKLESAAHGPKKETSDMCYRQSTND